MDSATSGQSPNDASSSLETGGAPASAQKATTYSVPDRRSVESLDSFASAMSSEQRSQPSPVDDNSRPFRKSKSDNSLKEGIKTTAHVVRDVAHLAKEAIKDAVVNPLRGSGSAPNPDAGSGTSGAKESEGPVEGVREGTEWLNQAQSDVPAASQSWPRNPSRSVSPTPSPFNSLPRPLNTSMVAQDVAQVCYILGNLNDPVMNQRTRHFVTRVLAESAELLYREIQNQLLVLLRAT